MSNTFTESPLGLIDVLGQLWRRKVVVILVTAAFAAAALAWSLLQTKTYEATAQLSVGQTVSEQLIGNPVSEITQIRKAPTQARILGSAAFAERMRVLLKHPVKLRAASTPQSDVISVTSSASTGPQARDDAQAAAAEFVKMSQANTVDQLQKVSEDINRRIAELDAQTVGQPEGSAKRTTLDRRAESLLARVGQVDVAIVAAKEGVVQVISRPAVPDSPVAPKPFRNGIAGGLLGAVVASVVALRRQHSPDAANPEAPGNANGAAVGTNISTPELITPTGAKVRAEVHA